MSLSYQILLEGRLVLAKAADRLSVDDIGKYLRGLAGDPILKNPHDTVFDLREMETLDIKMSDLAQIVEQVQVMPDKLGARRFAIVTHEPDVFEKGRQWHHLTAVFQRETVVFSDMMTAKVWLGIDLDLFPS